ncbi:MAG: ATP synthase F1 subunit gamma [Phycisphaerae bacterium]
MANARKILKRANSVRNIRTITKTMEMVSTARFKQIHDRSAASRPYTNRISSMIGDMVSRQTEPLDHPLMRTPPKLQRDVLLVIGATRGLAGAYTAGVTELALQRVGQLAEHDYEVVLYAAGKRGISDLKSNGLQPDREFPDFDHMPDYGEVGELTDELVNEFLDEKISGVEIAYTQFISAGKQSPAISQILPLTEIEPPPRPITTATPPRYDFMPTREAVLSSLLPAAVKMRVFQCFLDAAASEQFARMNSMRSATEAADDMIQDLTVTYNRQRQAQITTELAEIMGGRSGIEG